ncbi:MAG: DUF4920 domain-containing protein [Polyangiaceae bacterium]
MREQALAHSVARYKAVWSAGLVALAAVACNTPPAEQKPEPAAANTAPAPAAGYKLYGSALDPKLEPVSLSEVLSKPKAYEGKTVHVDAKVRRACSQKGCWMELAEGAEDKAATCRVTFKDYGFFVPTDSAGAEARLEGVVKLKKVTADHVQHMEQEGATFADKHPDGSASEVALVATGVELKK